MATQSTGYGIDREEALALMQAHIENANLRKHCLASEAVLRALAKHLGEDEELWGLSGLLHDLDAESHPELHEHTRHTVALLQERGVHADIIEAIRLHNESAHQDKRTSILHHALAAGETVTGLIIASALVRPDKQLASVKVKSVRKRFRESAFARGANREIIAECVHCGLEVDDFLALAHSHAGHRRRAGTVG